MNRPLVLCIINEAWFFRSHFLPWALAAQAAGFDVTVLATPGDAVAELERAGVAVVASKAERGGLWPKGLLPAARQVASLIERSRPTVIHAFGLHGMVIAALARRLSVPTPLVISVTGLGFLASRAQGSWSAAALIARTLRRALDGGTTRWLTENPHDAMMLDLGGAAAEGRVVQLGGAGIDLASFAAHAMPARPPLKLIMVARMVRSKGADLAVAAVAEARLRGLNATLTLVGAPDSANPRAYSDKELRDFAVTPGVAVLGPRTDIAALLADHHLFILPSRGGEGLPKALLEAAAAGRPALVSDVPGCRDFVVDGETGFIAPPENAGALTAALLHAATADLAAMGLKARQRVGEIASVEAVAGTVVDVYRQLVGAAPGSG